METIVAGHVSDGSRKSTASTLVAISNGVILFFYDIRQDVIFNFVSAQRLRKLK